MYSVIIFDFFDVIRTDAYRVWLDLHNYRLDGIFLESVQRMDRGDISLTEFLDILGGISGQTRKQVQTDMDNGAKLDYEVLDIIQKLGNSFKIGLLSNAPSDFLRNLLGQYDLEKYFDVIVISSEVGLIKPHPEIFTHILEKMEVTADKAIFIDDNQRNIIGAENVGIKSILYKDHKQLLNELEQLNIFL